MAEADILQRQLLETQNPDGGWGYHNGSSWTEPTAFALLALQAHNHETTRAHQRGLSWLEGYQRPDGGWPPKPTIPISTWVTSLASLALPQTGSTAGRRRRATEWLLAQMEPEMSPVEALVFRVRNIAPPVQTGGSPWFPGTAAWIGPTAISVLALSRAAGELGPSQLSPYVRAGQRYILCRRCRDGGWNHGGSRYMSENSSSYPEMTGMALLALHGAPPPELERSLKLAEEHLATAGSIEALSWLQLALIRHGREYPAGPASWPCRTTRDVSLRLLALAAQKQRYPLWAPN